jgi:uncharacterized protein YjbI with pentapeptide repeats
MEDIHSSETEFYDQAFNKIDLHEESIDGKKFYDCSFTGCNFNGAELTNCKFSDCDFQDCNLSTIDITGSAFRGVKFKNCKIIGVNWTSASWPNIQISSPVEFDDCILDSSTFYGLYLQEAKIEACHAHDVDFTEADCSKVSFIQSDLLDCTFNNTNLTYADFSDAFNYGINVFDNQVKGAKFSLPEAASLLDSLDIEILI